MTTIKALLTDCVMSNRVYICGDAILFDRNPTAVKLHIIQTKLDSDFEVN